MVSGIGADAEDPRTACRAMLYDTTFSIEVELDARRADESHDSLRKL
jgi:hypothetical protein